VKLPGVGPYTAGAIQAFAWNKSVIFIETNIRTVFIHFFFPKKKKVSDKELLPLIEKSLFALPTGQAGGRQARVWYSALMDYGTMLKKEHRNPSRRSAHHNKQSRFEGSDRQIRGAIIKALVEHKKLTEAQLIKTIQKNQKRANKQLQKLQQEGFISKKGNIYVLA